MSITRTKNDTLAFVGLMGLFTLVCVLVGLALWWSQTNDDQFRTGAILVSCATITFLVPVFTAMFQRPYDVFHPLNFIALSLFFGVFGRTLFILCSDSPVVNELLDDRPLESIIPGAVLSLFGTVFFCSGFLLPRSAHLKLYTLSNFLERFSQNRFMIFLPLIFAVSAGGVYMFLQATGFQFDGFTSLSSKRRVVINDVESSLGFVRLFAQDLPRTTFLCLLGVWLTCYRKSPGLIIAIIGFAILAIALPFSASSRGIVVVTLIAACVLVNHMRAIDIKALFAVGLISFLVLSGMLAMRRVHNRGIEFGEALSEMGFEPLFGNHNFADVVKLAHIYEAVPAQINYKYGSSFVSILYAPIPRSIWQNKPPVAMGREISEKIYNRGMKLKDKGGGTPPGLFAESIINFSVWGFPVAVLMAGALLRVIHNTLYRLADLSVPGAVLYASVIPAYCLSMMSGDFTRSLMQGITALVMVVGLTALSRLRLVA